MAQDSRDGALSEALKNIRGDFLFWQREVYEHLNRAGKGKSPNTSSTPWPDHWAFKNPKGVAIITFTSGSCGRSQDPPGKGRSKGGQNRQGKGQMTGGSDKGHTETPGRTSPTFPWIAVRCRSRQSRPSSCCTLGRMMRGPWMLSSMPTTRPSRSTFGQWTSGERVEMLDRTCWETSLTLAFVGGGPNCRTRSILRWFQTGR